MGKRAHYVMVPEDDPQWVRFWALYEKRSSKKDARKAWAELNPSPELVDRIVEALAWQFQQPDWVKQDHAFAPLPATYLRGERWTDERPVRKVRMMSDGAALVFQTLNMGKP